MSFESEILDFKKQKADAALLISVGSVSLKEISVLRKFIDGGWTKEGEQILDRHKKELETYNA